MKQKIQTVLQELNHGLVEREPALKAALLTVLAGENLVLIGPPGTGKSLIARRVAEALNHSNDNNADYFEYLLTKFSTPEEIFGPLSISELKKDCFKRNTAGYLPSVKIAFLDEIFKASSSILNALLTILNERLYHNGAQAQQVPLQALIAASNELPTDQEELNALYDRFLVRSFVDYVSEQNLPLLFAHNEPPTIHTHITAQDLADINNAVQSVTMPPEICEAIQQIWIQHKDTFKEDRREALSDRRLKKVLHLLRVSAVTNGRTELDLSDVLLLKDCLWNHQDNALKVRELIVKTLQRYSREVPLTDNNVIAAGNAAIQKPRMAQVTAKLNAKEKGYKGQGAEEDPILIENAQDLMGLDSIGAKGYYFRQTADIDCTALTTWHTINLQGHYDGGGYFIEYYEEEYDDTNALFQSIQAQSSVKNLKLRGLYLASSATGSQIEACESNRCLIDGDATDCTIAACQSAYSLVKGQANNCKISDCLLALYVHESNFHLFGFGNDNRVKRLGGISSVLLNSTVERCFVTGTVNLNNYEYYFYGITRSSNASTVRHCAIGKFELEKTSWGGRIAGDIQNNSTLENNVSIDSNGQYNDAQNGKSISAALWNQRYFEHTLGWDFDNVWEWDDEKDHPVLRPAGASVKTAAPATPTADTVDLLSQQLHANIWL